MKNANTTEAVKTVEFQGSLQPVLTELHKAFDKFNEKFYEGALPQVIIAVRSQGKRVGVLGWFTPAKVWTDGQEDKHEIVITAETLNRPWMDIMQTLHHEMIHLYCETNGIQDTSRNGAYHNKAFRDESLKRGFEHLNEKPDSKIGWSYISLTEETKKLVEDTFEVNTEVFGVARKSYGSKEKKPKESNRIIWVCPSCGAKMSSSKLEGIKPYCMNDNEGQKEACAVMFEAEIPDNFKGKIPVTAEEAVVLEWMAEYQGFHEEDMPSISLEEFADYGYEEEVTLTLMAGLMKKKLVIGVKEDEEYLFGLSMNGRRAYMKEGEDD